MNIGTTQYAGDGNTYCFGTFSEFIAMTVNNKRCLFGISGFYASTNSGCFGIYQLIPIVRNPIDDDNKIIVINFKTRRAKYWPETDIADAINLMPTDPSIISYVWINERANDGTCTSTDITDQKTTLFANPNAEYISNANVVNWIKNNLY